MPKARKSTRNSDAMDAEGHEELEAMTAEDDEILKMKQKLAEMEREASSLREQEQGIDVKALDEEMAKHPEHNGGHAGKPQKTPEELEKEKAERQEIDSRSVFVGQVDYGAEPGMLAEHFKKCGTVNRVTILTDKFENPKGFAYVEFLEKDAVDAAVLLDGTGLEEFPNRKLKVSAKRTNVPGMKAGGRGRGRGGRFGPFGGMMMVPMMMPYGRGRGRGRGGRGGRGRGGGAPGSSPY